MKNSVITIGIPIALAGTIIMGVSYAAVQQDLRQSANDPQIQEAEDASRALTTGVPPAALIGQASVDIAHSLQVAAADYDLSGTVRSSSVSLDGATPSLPAGVLQHAKADGEDRLTWQPAPGVRLAAVVVYYQGTASSTSGYLLVARSLREVEIREGQLGIIMGLGWAVFIIATFISVITPPLMKRRREVGAL